MSKTTKGDELTLKDDRPILLDLFSCAGGAAVGYDRAGFRVIGVDIDPQPNYPFEFHQMDAIQVLRDLIAFGEVFDIEPDAIHTSPPCQYSSALTKGVNKNNGKTYVNLIPETRLWLGKLQEFGHIPTIIENVNGAEMRKDLTLCGEMFGLGVLRHRHFEVNFEIAQPPHIKHRGRVKGWRHGEYFDGSYFQVYGDGGGKGSVAEWQVAMDIHHTNVRKEIAEAIPPAYSEYIGGQLMAHLKKEEAA